MYLATEGNSKSKISFTLKTNKFKLDIFCFKKGILEDWMTHLAQYCIKTNFLEEFTLKKKLDKGGFAVVYLGERKKDKQVFALKLMDKRKVENEKSYVSDQV